MSNAEYPRKSNNVHQNKLSLANSLGKDTDLRNWNGLDIYEAPVARYEENNFLVNKYGKSTQIAKGKVGLSFVDKVLDINPSTDQDLLVTLVDPGESAETGETYRAVLDVESSPYPDEMDSGLLYPIMMEEIPDGMEPGFYDFVVNSGDGNYAVAESTESIDSNSIDPVVSLEDMI